MKRRLVAALACRVQGSRLYGKPLQNLEPGVTILDHILRCVAASPEIDATVLGISEGIENHPFVETARRHEVGYIIGDQKDVMWRLVQCGRAEAATDVFRVTTECPFTIWEMLPELWRRHVERDSEITVADRLPEGVSFEIYRLDALARCHSEGLDSDRSEYVSAYPRQNQHRFRVDIVRPPAELERMDLRLTVDYPEDLVLCRRVYEALKPLGPRIPIAEIVRWIDAHPEIAALVKPYSVAEPVWDGVPQRVPA
jgi:spore coat polysaccharide biosynthesis protein SpsF